MMSGIMNVIVMSLTLIYFAACIKFNPPITHDVILYNLLIVVTLLTNWVTDSYIRINEEQDDSKKFTKWIRNIARICNAILCLYGTYRLIMS